MIFFYIVQPCVVFTRLRKSLKLDKSHIACELCHATNKYLVSTTNMKNQPEEPTRNRLLVNIANGFNSEWPSVVVRGGCGLWKMAVGGVTESAYQSPDYNQHTIVYMHWSFYIHYLNI